MRININRISVSLFILICLLVSGSAGATNYLQSHGENFSYVDDSDTHIIFPVIWDLRDTYGILHDYYVSYGWSGSSTRSAVDSLMEEAWGHGVNTVMLRSEIGDLSFDSLRMGPQSSNTFVILADDFRTDSLHVIAGGFWSMVSTAGFLRAEKTVDYLATYYDDYDDSGPGKFIGILGFDEPDARFEGPGWNQCQFNWKWFKIVQNTWNSIYTDVDSTMRFTSFLDRWCTTEIIEGDTIRWYQQTIPLFCDQLFMPVFDNYPLKVGVEVNSQFSSSTIDFDSVIGATDLLPSPDIEYAAYTSQDELFTCDGDSFKVYSFINETSLTEDLDLELSYKDELPEALREDVVWAASDFRATDIGNRISDEHVLNGAVVFLDEGDVGINRVYCFDTSGEEIDHSTLTFPQSATYAVTACIGEYNYEERHDADSLRRGGLIGNGERRILVCYNYLDGFIQKSGVRVFDEDCDACIWTDGTYYADLGSWEPDGAVWGIFWSTGTEDVDGDFTYGWDAENSEDTSGFILYQEDGDYMVVWEAWNDWTNRYEWQMSSSIITGELFEVGELSFVARCTQGYPSYVAGVDFLCGIVPDHGSSYTRLRYATGDSASTAGDVLEVFTSDHITQGEDFLEYADVTDAQSFRKIAYGSGEYLVLALDDGGTGSEIYPSTGGMYFPDTTLSVNIDTNARETSEDPAPLLPGARPNCTRFPFRASFILYNDPPDVVASFGYADLDNSATSALLYYPVSIDTMFTYGIENTQYNGNCLIQNLRCAGRHSEADQSDFYASQDSLLYLFASPIVHGARGVVLRATDLGLFCGNGGTSVPLNKFRAPDLLLNWGPSIDTTNVDMLSRTHSVVRMLSGKGTSNPDFLSALVDSGYEVLSNYYASNGYYSSGWVADTTNNCLNFIALRNTTTADLLLIVVNDSDDDIDEGDCVYFPNYGIANYFAPEWIAGFEGDTLETRAVMLVNIDFSDMPAFTASLYLIERED